MEAADWLHLTLRLICQSFSSPHLSKFRGENSHSHSLAGPQRISYQHAKWELGILKQYGCTSSFFRFRRCRSSSQLCKSVPCLTLSKSDASEYWNWFIFQLSPKYLHTNSTSHTWPFSAIAELIGELKFCGYSARNCFVWVCWIYPWSCFF